MHELANELLTHLRGAWRYRWYAVLTAWLVAIAGWIFVFQMPNRYEASARVYVDTQSVLRPLLAGVAVQPNVEQMVIMMSRTLISRPNVERLIRMSDMDVKLKTAEERDRLITRLVKELTIKSAGAENLYTISYIDNDPQLARRVVQSLLTIFVEGSLGNKRKDAESAQRFINEQLKTYNERLVAAENAVTEFKRRHMGLMGDGKQTYYARLAESETALNQAVLDLKEAENSRDAIRKQTQGEELPSLIAESGTPERPSSPELDGRIQELEKKLDGLRLTYTERHPDIIALVRMIEQLKAQKQQEEKLKKPAATARSASPNPMAAQLAVSLAEAEATVSSMKARVAEYQRRYNALKAAANAIPQMDAEYTQLTRDYDVTKKNYEVLLTRLESAQISGSMEGSSSVMDFRIIDPPQVPPNPAAPNRLLLMSAVLLAALAAGAAFAFFMSEMRPTLFDETRLQLVSGLPVFGTVVMAWTEAQIARRKKAVLALGLSFLTLVSAYGAIITTLIVTAARAQA
jgi:polysaccharide chain length determinant protein (PEP-CTERM system associated)